ncbi:hypothetical protein [Nonomuraea sp. NPDC046570]|uniref:hypothetical protein n=1 Tax=Nonomuraea sp. NPDC046570 TaxID=3155255 RepID=UPI0033EE59AD
MSGLAVRAAARTRPVAAPWRVSRELFLLEARRLAGNPLLWGMAVLVLALQTYLSWDQQPDMGIDPIAATGTAMCLAGMTLLVANLAASRDRRHRMPESLAGLPSGAEHRTRALLLATPLVGGLVAGLVLALYLAIRYLSGPVAGGLDPLEPLTAVAATAFAAVLGVAVGRWLPWLIAGPLVMATLGFLIFQNSVNGSMGWWLPVMQRHAVDWPARPSGPHLVYVLALTALAAGAALLKHGRGRLPLLAVVASVAVAVPTGATAAAVEPVDLPRVGELDLDDVDPRVRERFFGPRAHRCERRAGIVYCAYPEYVSWIPLWEKDVAGPLAGAIPPEHRALIPPIRQLTPTWSHGEDWKVPAARPPMTWKQADRERTAQQIAYEVLRFRRQCDARGQARTLVALWLVGQVGKVAEPDRITWRGQVMAMGGVDYGAAEVGYAGRLLAAPGTRERLWAHWDTLTGPSTTIGQALPLLGLRQEFPLSRPGVTPCR